MSDADRSKELAVVIKKLDTARALVCDLERTAWRLGLIVTPDDIQLTRGSGHRQFDAGTILHVNFSDGFSMDYDILTGGDRYTARIRFRNEP